MKTSKYENRCMILWDDLPIRPTAFHAPGDDHGGWWPVVEVKLNETTYKELPHLLDFALVICVYQLMWEELVAWPIPVTKVTCTSTWVG